MPSTFLDQPLEIRLKVYQAYFGSWSASLDTGSHVTDLKTPVGTSIQLNLNYSSNLLLSCKQVHKEIQDFDCVRKCFISEIICPRHVSWLSYEFFRCHWVFRSTTVLTHSHLGLLSSPKWRPVSVLPSLKQILINNDREWSSTLSLETGMQDTAKLLQSRARTSHVLCRQEDFETLKTISSNNGIVILINTILRVKDRCNVNTLPIKIKVLIEPDASPRLLSHKFPTMAQESGFLDAVTYHDLQDQDRVHSFPRKCCCSFWSSKDDWCPYAYHSRSSAANFVYMPSDMVAAMEAFKYE